MSLPQGNAVTSNNFGIQIDGVMVEFLTRVDGLTVEQTAIPCAQNNEDGKRNVAILPGPWQPGTVTVERGMTQSSTFNDWINDSMAGRMDSARKNATIIQMDPEGNPVKRWHLRNAWCSDLRASSSSADDSSVLTETITIQFEEVTVESA
ncbi:phage tail protein [Streptomyces sp. 7-21]|jgi:phage tail-like protein|uniref:phage tail protein n=1 Tax=Streptomyces sp. 7-21 TaxID=2802283 RepID=UPI00191D8B98|nr:phage tail protein [Streptomyces sp. 7-21]MBL1068021.1 phage tail protein [Streptomyces sp. 7-21]